jgi:hypothetical protein
MEQGKRNTAYLSFWGFVAIVSLEARTDSLFSKADSILKLLKEWHRVAFSFGMWPRKLSLATVSDSNGLAGTVHGLRSLCAFVGTGLEKVFPQSEFLTLLIFLHTVTGS